MREYLGSGALAKGPMPYAMDSNHRPRAQGPIFDGTGPIIGG